MRTERKLKNLIAALLAFTFLVTAVSAPAEEISPATGRTVTVGYYSEAGMMNGAEEGAVKSGYAYEYMQELASHAGWKYQYVYKTFSELYPMLLNGEIDMLPYITWTEERSHLVLFPDRQMGDEQFYIAALTPGTLSDDLHELQGKKIGTTRDAFQNIPFLALIGEKGIDCELVELDSPDVRWIALENGAVDYSIETSTLFQSIDLHVVYEFGERYPYYMVLAPGRTDLLAELNEAHREIDESTPGLLDSLRLKYFKSIPLFKEIPQEGRKWLSTHDVIRIGTFNNDAPYVIENADGPVTGIAPDQDALILNELGIGLPVEWKIYPGRDELIAALYADEIDCIDPYYHSYSDAENDGLIISQTVYDSDFSVLYKGQYSETTLARIATPVTRLGASYVRDNYPGAQIIPCQDGYDCLKKLESGEATCVVMYTDALQSIAAKSGKNYKFKALETQCEVCFAALPEDAGLISIFNKAIPFLTDVEKSAIQNKYNIEKEPDTVAEFFRAHPECLWGGIAVIFALIAILAMIRIRKEKQYAAEKKEAEFYKDLTGRFSAQYDAVFFGDLDTGKCRIIANRNNSWNISVGAEITVDDIVRYVEKTAHHLDIEKIRREMIGYAQIRQKLAVGESDTITFRKNNEEGYSWYRATLNRVTENEILIGFKNNDNEILSGIVNEKLLDEYDALYVADLEREELIPVRASRVSAVGHFADIMPYREIIRKFAETVAPQYKEDWIKFGNIAYMRQFMALDEHREYVYELPGTEKTMRRFSIDVLERVNGEAVTLMFSFMGIDDYRAQTILMQRRMSETNRIIEALSEDFGCVNYVDLSEEKVNDITESYRSSALLKKLIPTWEETKSFGKKLDLLAEHVVYGPDRERFREETQRDVLVEKLKVSDVVFVNTRLMIEDEIRYYQFKFSAVREKGALIGAVAGLHSVDEEMKKEMEAQKQLQEALSMAQSANRAKTTFLNNMSHDIRTPMNAIIGFTGLALNHIDNKEQVRDYLGKIGQSSSHLLSLINDVLDMSRIESGKMDIEEKPENLPDIIHTLHDIIKPNVHAKQQELFISTENLNDEAVICDKLRLSQVLLNILSNSIKYTAPGGTISMRITEKGVISSGYATYEFRVRDNGMGMEEEFLKTIFDPFSRVRSSTVSGIQGTGLGMAITKNIVDLMGGKIDIESEPGKGTEVTVSFEFKLAETDQKDDSIPEVKGRRVLVIDDDSETAFSVSAMLKDAGMKAEWCASGKEGVYRAQSSYRENDAYQMYIIDWLMPDVNGLETARRIRKIAGDKVPIIILSSYDWSDIEAEAREAGVTAFESKPLFPSDLHKLLLRLFGKESGSADISSPQYDFKGKKLLLVEDNEMNREIATEILEEQGFVIDTAEDGNIAVEKVKAAKPGDYDLILMDIQMPTMNGYEATKQIRALGTELSKLPIIAMTANAFEEDRKYALDAGMDEHVAKPIDVEKLKRTLAKFL